MAQTTDYYAAISTVFGAIQAVHDEDADRVQALLDGLDLNLFIRASLGINELVIANTADRLDVSFDLLLNDARVRVLALEHDATEEDGPQ